MPTTDPACYTPQLRTALADRAERIARRIGSRIDAAIRTGAGATGPLNPLLRHDNLRAPAGLCAQPAGTRRGLSLWIVAGTAPTTSQAPREPAGPAGGIGAINRWPDPVQSC